MIGRPRPGRNLRRALLVMALAVVAIATGPRADAQSNLPSPAEIQAALANVRQRAGGYLGLMGYNVSPDGSANALSVNRTTVSGSGSSPELYLSQVGFGFTVSESLPLYMEIYGGYARYDPRAVFSGGQESRRVPFRWNNLTSTIGLGYDIRLSEYWWLRPILNGAMGYAAPDSTLFAAFIERRRDVDLSAFTNRHANVTGIGASLTLAYYDYRPARDIDFELRYTQIFLQTFGDTATYARGSSTAQTLSAWGRYRWPTGWEAFGRPIRWVVDGNVSWYIGDQRDAVGFGWALKVGGGIEFDIGRYEVGALGINLSRVRLIGRYFLGDHNITGTSFGIGMSF